MSKARSNSMYKNWKKITDSIYAKEMAGKDGVKRIVTILNKNGIKLRPTNHKLLAASYFVYDKDIYENKTVEKPLGIGFVYEKPSGEKTQDIFICTPDGELEKYYSERNMCKKYPAMRDTHKNNLPI